MLSSPKKLMRLDLNCDMGELKPGQKRNFDEAIMPYISSCNIACGFHSGSPLLMEKTIQAAIQHEVKIGAHPSYNDRRNFGRKSLVVEPSILAAELRYQIGALKGMVESYGQKLHHVKPHGALYNDMVANADLAERVVQVIKSIDPQLKIFALAESQVIDICKKNEMAYVHEGFADRRYQAINQLRSRSLEGAVIHAPFEVLEQVDTFLNKKVKLWSGEIQEINVESVCLHSDTLGAIELSKMIYQYLKDKNVHIAAVA